MNAKVKSYLSLGFKLLISFGIIYWLVQKGFLDFGALAKLLSPQYLISCLGLVFLVFYISNYRWLLLLRAQKFDVTVRSTFPLTFIGVFFSYAMPGGVGGDVVKGFYLLKDQNHRKLAAATTIFMDRIVGLYAMTFLAAIAVMLNWNFVMNKPELRAIATGIFAAFLIFTVSFAFAFSNRVHVSSTRQKLFSKLPFGARLAEIYTSIHAYSQNLKAFTFAFLLSLASQLVTVAVFKIIGEAMGESVPWVTYAFVIPIGLIATAIPISPAGVGVGQAVFLVLFTWKLGRQTTLGPNLATSYQVLVFLWGLVGAYFYFTRKKPVIEEAA